MGLVLMARLGVNGCEIARVVAATFGHALDVVYLVGTAAATDVAGVFVSFEYLVFDIAGEAGFAPVALFHSVVTFRPGGGITSGGS